MNGFKKFVTTGTIDINYKVLECEGTLEPTIEIVLSSLNQNVLRDSVYSNGLYYVKMQLIRTEWAENQGYANHSIVEKDFKEALAEFNSNIHWMDYLTPINIYLIKKIREYVISD